MKENYVRNNSQSEAWCAFGLSNISPSVAAPTKSLHHREDQRSVKSAKCLSYGEILPKPNPEDVSFWSTETPQFGNLALSFFYKFSGLFAILFVPTDFTKQTRSNINETRGEITRTIHFAHFGLMMSKNIKKNRRLSRPFWLDYEHVSAAISSAPHCRSIWNVSKILSRAKAINSTSFAILFTMIWRVW